jgi:AbrB family looped-hinge helix DNA binding protein
MLKTARRRLVRTLPKGQITIPSEFREALGIGPETLLGVELVEDHLEIAPLGDTSDKLRRYTDDDIARFLNEDKLDAETARKVRNLVKRGQA